MKGLDKNSETHNDTKKMLISLKDIMLKKNPEFMKQRKDYQEFIQNPVLQQAK